jgi:hypothetical protein
MTTWQWMTVGGVVVFLVAFIVWVRLRGADLPGPR